MLGLELVNSYDNVGRKIGMQVRENTTTTTQSVYSCDAKGQITGAVKRSADGTALPGLNYGYSYDEIGNRLTSTEGSVSNLYSSNLLNQYMSINTTPPTYDLDGNMLTDGKGWTFSYNGENRLITATNGNDRVEMNYDASGRRFEKKVYNGATLTKYERFVYNGFKLLEVRDGLNNNALTKSFTWQEGAGLDTPLSMKYNGQTGYYQLDGNKNVLKVTAQDGTVLANYTYGPFGQVLTSSGTWKDLNPWQFSSEYFDPELSLIYYNYRHYSPTLGRWTTRGPIDEQGGINLYAMVGNNIISLWDYLGLWIRLKSDDPDNFEYCAQTGDSLRKLAKKITGNEEDYVCLWPVGNTKDHGYPTGIWANDKYDASNLEKVWSNKVTLLITNDISNPFDGLSINPGDIFETIKAKSGQSGSPVSYLLINGHMSATGIGGYVTGGKYSKFTVTDYSSSAAAKEFDVSFERASNKLGPKRCWFSRDAEVRFAGCTSSGFAKDFAKTALRKSAMAYGTKYYMGWGTTYVRYASELDNGKWYPSGHANAPKISKDIFSKDIWNSHSGGL